MRNEGEIKNKDMHGNRMKDEGCLKKTMKKSDKKDMR